MTKTLSDLQVTSLRWLILFVPILFTPVLFAPVLFSPILFTSVPVSPILVSLDLITFPSRVALKVPDLVSHLVFMSTNCDVTILQLWEKLLHSANNFLDRHFLLCLSQLQKDKIPLTQCALPRLGPTYRQIFRALTPIVVCISICRNRSLARMAPTTEPDAREVHNRGASAPCLFVVY